VGSPQLSRQTSYEDDGRWGGRAPLLNQPRPPHHHHDPPIPSYDAAVAEDRPQIRVRSATETSRSAPSRRSRP
jgi:hypothetical protein